MSVERDADINTQKWCPYAAGLPIYFRERSSYVDCAVSGRRSRRKARRLKSQDNSHEWLDNAWGIGLAPHSNGPGGRGAGNSRGVTGLVTTMVLARTRMVGCARSLERRWSRKVAALGSRSGLRSKEKQTAETAPTTSASPSRPTCSPDWVQIPRNWGKSLRPDGLAAECHEVKPFEGLRSGQDALGCKYPLGQIFKLQGRPTAPSPKRSGVIAGDSWAMRDRDRIIILPPCPRKIELSLTGH
ncbi:uncharacterized protein BO97DRAFT_461337 [Aspergillus homomorphus CBS 101889]|uniref:Uncharacterized protein n=1 Tax=Aspergillus homomorphus (strain CBS 101889) TaxID=1450537 RepID=A0A395I729_ASPHC|nr:hypothetical protein BO97DRAFT_461337 [Aspergillus homomorphus CBS 101889]RAL15599.1 hypothetical protein BO97DRAFT_461337 [Aspergillus homomorphus CBS 101889]